MPALHCDPLIMYINRALIIEQSHQKWVILARQGERTRKEETIEEDWQVCWMKWMNSLNSWKKEAKIGKLGNSDILQTHDWCTFPFQLITYHANRFPYMHVQINMSIEISYIHRCVAEQENSKNISIQHTIIICT